MVWIHPCGPRVHSLLHPGWLILICNFEPLVSDVAINNQSSMEIIIVNKICTAFLPFFNLLRQVNAPKKKKLISYDNDSSRGLSTCIHILANLGTFNLLDVTFTFEN